ncbi:MAG TPA: CCA tRNA nucleotidyltransferase [Vitreimonas sp.]|uniref:CCA tRNA nucleotidyltransferase n=1 Tax=Vitreimonas sp. TaxID=3069702 RepID=UPI002D515B6C|nr:CCA tRNA nucleotidyltransferase [Vitreimonas sp.]HYD87882.1 CCA tRNA nucleotidyltransferase [Vitreimonas sp.]
MTASIAYTAWFKAKETQALIAALEAARPNGSRFVGGCVRNTLMGREVDDIDVATQLTPDQVTEICAKAGFAAHPTGIEHGTVTVVINHRPFEVTTLRRDVSTDGRRATVAFTEKWDEDAERRDFRMNALYADASGAVHDPTSGGLEDVRAGRVIFIGDAHTRLREDYLRILRFFRFNAWYAKGPLDPHGLSACADLVAGLDTLSAERIWKEVKKLLAAPDPRAAWEGMTAIEARARALPEFSNETRLDALCSIEADLMLTPDPMTRIAAALADQDSARALARRLKLSNEERERLVAALGTDVKITSYMSLREMRRAIYRLGNQPFRDRVMLAWAGAGGEKAQQWRALVAHGQMWTPPKLPLTGDEVMAAGVPAGPKVGLVMREVEDWWIDADFPDDKLSVIERLKAVAQGMS